MGISAPTWRDADGQDNQQAPEKRFADDVLRVEVSGPDQLNLTVVDVPGLFHCKFAILSS